MGEQPLERPSRFAVPSAALDLGAMGARQMRKVRLISLAVAIALHGSLAIWKVSMERKAIKPLTTRFIKREPRLVKPLELRKAPKPKRREMRRRMKQVRAKVDTRGISRAPRVSDVLERMVRPVAQVEQVASFERPALEPVIEAGRIEVARVGRRRVDLSLEMVDAKALDTGQVRALVVEDPEDRRGIRGFFHISSVYLLSSTYVRSDVRGTLAPNAAEVGRSDAPMALPHLAEAVNEYTDLHVDVAPDVSADSPELLKIPWVLLKPRVIGEPTLPELRNIGRYLTSGGFIFAEIGVDQWLNAPENNWDHYVFDAALATQGKQVGRHYVWAAIPNNHPIYHAFYDFDGPPAALDNPLEQRRTAGMIFRVRKDYMEGIDLDGRLVLVNEEKGIVYGWVRLYLNAGPRGTGFMGEGGIVSGSQDKRQFLQFGINTIVFALTQEGSIAQRMVSARR